MNRQYIGIVFQNWDDDEVLDSSTEIHRLRVDEMKFSVRLKNILEDYGFEFLDEVTIFSESDLLAMRSFGLTSLNELKEVLEKREMQLRNGRPPFVDIEDFKKVKKENGGRTPTIEELEYARRLS